MKRGFVAILAVAGLLAAALVAPPLTGHAAEPVNPVVIEEWEVVDGGRPRDPFAAGEDEIWFVNQGGDYLGRLTPSTGAFLRRDLPDPAGPHNLIVGADGMVWYAGNAAGYIGRYDPVTDAFERIDMPDAAARDPHTLVFDASEEHIWFTVQNGNFVGRLTVADRAVALIPVPTRGARPYGIRMGTDGVPWIVLLGTNKLARVDPESLELTEVELPASGARPRRVEVSSDGRVWYADYRRGYLGRYDPASGDFAEYALPSGDGSRPYGTAMDDRDRIWVVETGVQPNLMVGFDTKTEQVFSVTEIPSGGGSVRHMDYHRGSQTVWFGADTSTIGRAVVPAE